MATFQINGPFSTANPNNAQGVDVNLVAVDSLWGVVPAILSVPTDEVPIYGVNHFNTGLLANHGYTIGYLDETIVPYSTALNTITCGQVQSAFRYLPAGQSILDWTHDCQEGYYVGDPDDHIFTINRIAAATRWDASKVYLLKVTSQGVIPNGTFTRFQSQIDGEYLILNCAIPPVPSASPAVAKLPYINKLIANIKK